MMQRVLGRRIPILAALAAKALCFSLGCSPRAELLGRMQESEVAGAPGSPGANGEAGAGGLSGWSPPTRLEPVTDPNARDTDPTLTADQLELVFMSDRSGNKDLFSSTRASTGLPFGEPSPILALNSSADEQNPTLAPDGLTLWFHSGRDRTVGVFWVSERASRDDDWSEPTPLLLPIEQGSAVALAFDRALTTVVVTQDRGTAAGYELYVATRPSSTDELSELTSIDAVNGADQEYDPWLSPNGLWLAFHVRNADDVSDLFWSSRATTEDAFGAPETLSALNTPADDAAIELTADRTTAYFSSTRDGNEEIYVSTRRE